MNGFKVAVISFWLSANFGRSLNIARLREACRIDDGFRRCSQGGHCLPRSEVSLDCETDYYPCTSDEVRCDVNRKCVQRYLIGTEDGCVSDNRTMRLPCREDEFTCKSSGLCIPRNYVRNGRNDCNTTAINDVSDESCPLEDCNLKEFRCRDINERCIPREWVLDGYQDCLNNSDELLPLDECSENEFRCGNGRCVLRYRVVDGYADCDDESDEINSIKNCSTATEFRCNDTGRCIPRSWVMDGIEHCKDSSDEEVGANYACSNSEFSCRNEHRCLPSILLCDGISHCEDCSDEIEACHEPVMERCGNHTQQCVFRNTVCTNDSTCQPVIDTFGFKCASSLQWNTCLIPQWSLNDAHPFCPDGSDICHKNGSFACARCVSSGKIIGTSQVCNGVIDCADLTDECLCETCAHDNAAQKVCNSICYSDNYSQGCTVCQAGLLHCPGEEKCVELDRICDGRVDCSLSQIDESACSNADGDSCSYGNNDRCPIGIFEIDPFSSEEKMIRNPIFIALIWIQAAVAIFGNAAVLHKRAKRWKGYNPSKRIGSLPRINMAIANIGVGVMLVVIGSISNQMSGNYCKTETDWRKSTSCKSIGALTTWFIEVSLLTLVILSSYRLYGYCKAFKAVNQRMRISILWELLVWVVSFIISCVPISPGLNEKDTTEILISSSPYFKGPITLRREYRKFTERTTSLSHHYASGNFSFSRITPEIVGQFGYYQTHGVCLPTWSSSDGTFNVFLLCVNMVSLVFSIAVNSWLLYKLATKQIGKRKRKFLLDGANRKQVMVMTLACTYFFCWLGIMIINFAGGRVSTVAYPIATLILFPLPSAISPVIYTSGFKDIRKYVASKLLKTEGEERASEVTKDGNGNVDTL